MDSKQKLPEFGCPPLSIVQDYAAKSAEERERDPYHDHIENCIQFCAPIVTRLESKGETHKAR